MPSRTAGGSPCARSTRPSGAMSSRCRLPGALVTVRTRPDNVAAKTVTSGSPRPGPPARRAEPDLIPVRRPMSAEHALPPARERRLLPGQVDHDDVSAAIHRHRVLEEGDAVAFSGTRSRRSATHVPGRARGRWESRCCRARRRSRTAASESPSGDQSAERTFSRTSRGAAPPIGRRARTGSLPVARAGWPTRCCATRPGGWPLRRTAGTPDSLAAWCRSRGRRPQLAA